jgi:predicted nuclease of predicted toxin-antitoxin system
LRFLVDEGVDARLAAMLVAAGHDVVEIAATTPGTDDLAVASRAVTERRIIVTVDKDFGDLAFRDGTAMSGVILIRMPGCLLRSDRPNCPWRLACMPTASIR